MVVCVAWAHWIIYILELRLFSPPNGSFIPLCDLGAHSFSLVEHSKHRQPDFSRGYLRCFVLLFEFLIVNGYDGHVDVRNLNEWSRSSIVYVKFLKHDKHPELNLCAIDIGFVKWMLRNDFDYWNYLLWPVFNSSGNHRKQLELYP